MSFDITSVLKGVSDPDTGRQQISYLPVDKLDPDENNFYSLEGIDWLADNIATIGLQQPIRVRQGSEPGRYTIVSGHRRLAAIQILLDSEDGSGEPFRNGVPCIIETGEASAALQELRLIFANASTRIMGPAEMSRQAERVEALLYQLKEEGMGTFNNFFIKRLIRNFRTYLNTFNFNIIKIFFKSLFSAFKLPRIFCTH